MFTTSRFIQAGLAAAGIVILGSLAAGARNTRLRTAKTTTSTVSLPSLISPAASARSDVSTHSLVPVKDKPTSGPAELSIRDLITSDSLDTTSMSIEALPLNPQTNTVTSEVLNLDTQGLATDIGTTVPGEESAELPDLSKFEKYVQSKKVETKSITLNEVVILTVCRNLNIKIKDIANRIQHDEFHAQEGIFDLRISGINELTRSDTASTPFKSSKSSGTSSSLSSSVFSSPVTHTQKNQVTIGQLLPTGGLLELIFEDDRIRTSRSGAISPYYFASGTAQVSQPLLKNGGPLVTQSKIVVAQYDNQITADALRLQMMQELSTAIQTYYELIFSVSNVDVLKISLAQAQELLRVNRAKYEAGVLPELDVLQAQSQVADRQVQVLTAIQSVEGVSDALKTQLAEICDLYDRSLRPSDTPQVPDFKIDEQQFVRDAVCFRPEFDQQRWNVEKQNLNLRVAENQTLPQVDFFANYTGSGVGDSNRRAIENAEDSRHFSYNVGLQYSYPLQNREARYRYHQAEKNLESSFLQLELTRNNIILDVRNAVRSIETNRERIDVGKASVAYNKATVDTAMKRQQAGLATSFDVLAFQTNLANARVTLLRAVVDFNKAIIQLEQAKGTLLDKLCVQVNDGRSPARKTGRKAAQQKTAQEKAPASAE